MSVFLTLGILYLCCAEWNGPHTRQTENIWEIWVCLWKNKRDWVLIKEVFSSSIIFPVIKVCQCVCERLQASDWLWWVDYSLLWCLRSLSLVDWGCRGVCRDLIAVPINSEHDDVMRNLTDRCIPVTFNVISVLMISVFSESGSFPNSLSASVVVFICGGCLLTSWLCFSLLVGPRCPATSD